MSAQPRRLLWAHQYHPGPQAAGGVRPRITIEGFRARGWQVRLVCGSGGYQEAAGALAAAAAADEGVLWHSIPLRATGPDARARSYWEFFWRGLAAGSRGFRPDLVFCSSPPLTQTLQAVLLARRWRVPMVLELRDLWPAFLEELELVRSRSALAALRRLETLAYRSASAIVSASPAFRPYLEARGVRADAIVDAPHGARDRDPAALREAGMTFRTTHRLGERPVVLYAGALHSHYGLDSWLAAAAILAARRPDIAFVVAGGGRQQDRVAAAARSLPNLHYLGTVPRAELDGAIGAADLGLVCLSRAPSFVSVLPGKLVELMSCGVPVVTTVSGQAARLVERAGAGWIVDNDSHDLAAAIELGIAAGSAERARRGAAGRRFVQRWMAADAQASAIVDACEAAVGGLPVALRSCWSALFEAKAGAGRSFARDGAVAARAFDRWLDFRGSPFGSPAAPGSSATGPSR